MLLVVIHIILRQTFYIEKISSLNHKIFYDTMESSPFESCRKSISLKFSGAELSEVLSSLWYYISEQLYDDTSDILANTSKINLNVQKIEKDSELYCRSHSHIQKHNRIVRMSQLSLNLIPSRHF